MRILAGRFGLAEASIFSADSVPHRSQSYKGTIIDKKLVTNCRFLTLSEHKLGMLAGFVSHTCAYCPGR